MKVIIVTFGNGERWLIPAQVIVDNRNAYYQRKDGEDFNERAEIDFLLRNNHELLDWARNNMNWEDVSTFAKLIPPYETPDYEGEWPNASLEIEYREIQGG